MSSRQLEGTERLQASAKGGDNRVSNDSRGVGILVVNDSDPELKRLVTLIESVSGIIVGLPSSAATVVRGVSSANPLIDALTILLNHARAAEVSDFGKLAKGLPKVIVLDAYLPERPGGPPNLVSSQKVLDLVEEIWSCFLDVSKGLLGNSEWNLVVLQYTEMLPRLVADASKPRNSRDWLGFAQKGDLAVVSDSAGLEANYLAAQINRLLSEDKTKGAGAEEIFLYLGMVGQALQRAVHTATSSEKPVLWIQSNPGDGAYEVASLFGVSEPAEESNSSGFLNSVLMLRTNRNIKRLVIRISSPPTVEKLGLDYLHTLNKQSLIVFSTSSTPIELKSQTFCVKVPNLYEYDTYSIRGIFTAVKRKRTISLETAQFLKANHFLLEELFAFYLSGDGEVSINQFKNSISRLADSPSSSSTAEHVVISFKINADSVEAIISNTLTSLVKNITMNLKRFPDIALLAVLKAAHDKPLPLTIKSDDLHKILCQYYDSAKFNLWRSSRFEANGSAKSTAAGNGLKVIALQKDLATTTYNAKTRLSELGYSLKTTTRNGFTVTLKKL